MDEDLLCKLCDVKVTSSKEMKFHIQGKKHLLNLNPNDAVEESLPKKDERVHCKLCDVFVVNPKELDIHLAGKKHQSNLNHNNKDDSKEKCSVYISNLPNLVPQKEILEFFLTYGKIKDYHFGPNNFYAIVQFEAASVASTLLQTELKFKGRKLMVKPRLKKEQPAHDQVENEQTENFKEINENVKNCPDFESQLAMLVDCCRPKWREAKPKYIDLCRDLHLALLEEFPNCKVHPFGSTVTGLGFNSSDVDIFVQVFNSNAEKSNDDLASEYVLRAKKILSKHEQYFSQVIAIPKAKTPICKFMHNLTRIHCDFNFKNMLGVCNSQLICYYLSLDVRLTPLMIVIKYWGKVHNVTGSSGKFSNYSFIMMFLSYLQQVHSLPSVVSLQTPATLNLQENWNGGFDGSIKCNLQSLSQSNSVDILAGFFEYYALFDYSLYIVCPYAGRPVQKVSFVEPHMLEPCFERYKVNIAQKLPLKTESAVCIQDPYEHTHNLCSSVQQRHLNEFVTLCEIAHGILKKKPLDATALYDLFTVQPEPGAPTKEVNKEKEITFKLVFNNKYGVFLNKLIDGDSETTSEKQTSIRTEWYSMVHQFVLGFLTQVMKFTVNIEDDALDHKMRRVNGQNDVHDTNLVESMTLNCTGNYNLWESRRALIKELKVDETLSSFEIQKALSDLVKRVMYKDEDIKDPIVIFNLEIQAILNPTEMNFKIVKIMSKKKCFRNMTSFVTKNLPRWFDLHMMELAKNKTLDGNTDSKPDENLAQV